MEDALQVRIDELDRIMEIALNDERSVDQYKGIIRELSNEIRAAAGADPATDVNLVLHPYDARVDKEVIGEESTYSRFVFSKGFTQVVEESEFGRAFVEDSEKYLQKILEICDDRLIRLEDGERVVIYPPLLVHSTDSGSARFKFNRNVMERAPGRVDADAMVVFFPTGPVIPVVREKAVPEFTKHGPKWYESTGDYSLEGFLSGFRAVSHVEE